MIPGLENLGCFDCPLLTNIPSPIFFMVSINSLSHVPKYYCVFLSILPTFSQSMNSTKCSV